MNSYLTLRQDTEAEGIFIDRKSKFIAQLKHVSSEEEAQDYISHIRTKHYNARHNVPAWILRDGRERQSDDGEPQRTSGMPTLEVLRAENLKDICIVVTRYFGGTLLGPGGLVRAYTTATQAAIEDAYKKGYIVEMTRVVCVTLPIEYKNYDRMLRLAQDCHAKVLKTTFTDHVEIQLLFKEGTQHKFINSSSELLNTKNVAKVSRPHFDIF